MHITTVCPKCKTEYRVKPDLIGQPMRCLTDGCEKIFRVEDAEATKTAPSNPPKDSVTAPPEPPPVRRPPKRTTQRTGSVGDIVPIRGGEAVAPEPSEEEPATASWQTPPPVRKETEPTSDRSEETPQESIDEEVAQDGKPAETKSPSWENAPPVRNEKAPASAAQPPSDVREEVYSESVGIETKEQRTKPVAAASSPQRTPFRPVMPPPNRWAKRIIVGLVFVVVIVLGGGGYYAWKILRETEEGLRAEAMEDYESERYPAASEKFSQLPEKFPQSDKIEEYRFLKQLSDLRGLLHTPDVATDTGIQQVRMFLKAHREKPPFENYKKGLATSWMHLITTFTERAIASPDPSSEAIIEQIEQVHEDYPEMKSALSKEQLARFERDFFRFGKVLVQFQRQEGVVAKLQRLADAPTINSLREFLGILRRLKKEDPALAADSRVTKAIQELYDGLLANVRYVKDPPLPGVRRGNTREEDVTNVWVDITRKKAKATDAGAPGSTTISSSHSRGAYCTHNRRRRAKCDGRDGSASIRRPCRSAYPRTRSPKSESSSSRPIWSPCSHSTPQGNFSGVIPSGPLLSESL